MDFKIPNFHGAFMGYNKEEVTDFLNRMNSELEIYDSRQTAAEKTIASLKSEIQTITNRASELAEENCQLETTLSKMRQDKFDYNNEKGLTMEQQEKLRTEIGALTQKNAELEAHQEELTQKLANLEQAAGEKQRLEQENEALRKTLETLEDTVQNHAQEKKCLQQENEQLRTQLEKLTQELSQGEGLRTECADLRETVNLWQQERDAVRDALISAQRMGEMVLAEARTNARQLEADAKQSAEQTMEQARQSAAQTLEEARVRNEALQASYDRMLMDTSKMKSELIDLYRRHLALLAEIPGQAEVPALEAVVLEAVGE